MFCGVVVAMCVTCSHGLKADIDYDMKENGVVSRIRSPSASIDPSPKPLKNKINWTQFDDSSKHLKQVVLQIIRKFSFVSKSFPNFKILFLAKVFELRIRSPARRASSNPLSPVNNERIAGATPPGTPPDQTSEAQKLTEALGALVALGSGPVFGIRAPAARADDDSSSEDGSEPIVGWEELETRLRVAPADIGRKAVVVPPSVARERKNKRSFSDSIDTNTAEHENPEAMEVDEEAAPAKRPRFCPPCASELAPALRLRQPPSGPPPTPRPPVFAARQDNNALRHHFGPQSRRISSFAFTALPDPLSTGATQTEVGAEGTSAVPAVGSHESEDDDEESSEEEHQRDQFDQEFDEFLAAGGEFGSDSV